MSLSFLDAVAKRRSYYKLSDDAVVDDDRVVELVEMLLKTMPSPFNVQSTRIVLLFGKEHLALWDIVSDTLQAIVPEAKFGATKRRIYEAFRSGRGTILFYEDGTALEALKHKFATYADRVDVWAEQCSGMHQFALWVALEDMGYGASLQHYNPLIDERVAKRWDIPSAWRLIAQMPFGVAKDELAPREQTSPPRSRMMLLGR